MLVIYSDIMTDDSLLPKKLTLLFVRSDLAEAGDVGVPPAIILTSSTQGRGRLARDNFQFVDLSQKWQ